MEICQRHLPIRPWMQAKTRRLPGIQPVDKGEWLLRDGAFAPQMADRDALIGEEKPAPISGGFVQVERQTLRKLPRLGAVVFGIHTYVIGWNQLDSAEQEAFIKARA